MIILSEVKNGHVKFTIEIDINEALMDMMKEGMKNMPGPMMMGMRKWRHMNEKEGNEEAKE